MDLLKEYNELQKKVFKNFFDKEIIPHLEDTDLIYWGMGSSGLDLNNDYDYMPPLLSDKIYTFLENNLPFYNRGLCEVYILMEIVDSPTNKNRTEDDNTE